MVVIPFFESMQVTPDPGQAVQSEGRGSTLNPGISELLLTETPGSLSERREQLLRDLSRAARELSAMVRPQPEEC